MRARLKRMANRKGPCPAVHRALTDRPGRAHLPAGANAVLRGLMRAARDCVHPQVELDADLPVDFERHAADASITQDPPGFGPLGHTGLCATIPQAALAWPVLGGGHATCNMQRIPAIQHTTYNMHAVVQQARHFTSAHFARGRCGRALRAITNMQLAASGCKVELALQGTQGKQVPN